MSRSGYSELLVDKLEAIATRIDHLNIHDHIDTSMEANYIAEDLRKLIRDAAASRAPSVELESGTEQAGSITTIVHDQLPVVARLRERIRIQRLEDSTDADYPKRTRQILMQLQEYPSLDSRDCLIMSFAEIEALAAGARAVPSEQEEMDRLRIEVETTKTLLAAWQKRAMEAERINPHGRMLTPEELEPFITEMRERTIPAIVKAVHQRQKDAAAMRHIPLSACAVPETPKPTHVEKLTAEWEKEKDWPTRFSYCVAELRAAMAADAAVPVQDALTTETGLFINGDRQRDNAWDRTALDTLRRGEMSDAGSWEKWVVAQRADAGFHWRGGLFAKGLSDGCVRLRYFSSWNYTAQVIDFVIPPNEWQSIVTEAALSSCPPPLRVQDALTTPKDGQ